MTQPVNLPQETRPQGDILIVDDIAENLEYLSKILNGQGHKVRAVLDGHSALKVAKSARPDLILLDVKMPELDGFEVCQRLKAEPQTRDIPVIFLSALDQTQDKVNGFTIGGVDYVAKPFQAEELLARVNTHLSLRFAQAQVQRLNAELEQRVIQRTAQLEREIGDRLKAQEELLHFITHNPLTNLPNRAFLMQRLGQIFNQMQSREQSSLVLMIVECKHLQLVNNSLGYSAGDQLVVAIVRRLQTALPPTAFLAHFSNDTFAILMENCDDLSAAIALTKVIHNEAVLPFDIADKSLYITFRMGIVQRSASDGKPKYLLRDANTALAQARKKGAAKVQIFNPAMYHRALHFFEIQNELNVAIAQQNLTLVYQPLQSLDKRAVTGLEALVRWHHPVRGVISPSEFISIAEETGLIIALDRYVLRRACIQLCQWQAEGLINGEFRLHVNLSSQQLSQPDFIDYLDQILHDSKANCCNLTLEITEEGLMQEDQTVLQILQQLKQRCIHVSIDDFGTGYSSLSYLQRLKVENLKIDRSFISPNLDGFNDGEDNPAIVRAIIDLAHGLGMTVTAEGVETLARWEQLKALGCDFAQGYLLGRPTSDFRQLFQAAGVNLPTN